MPTAKPNHIAALLRNKAASIAKSASADGVAQVSKGTVSKDPGEDELKAGLPADGTMTDDTGKAIPSNDLNQAGTAAANKGAPAEMPKTASERVAAIRNALVSTIAPQAVAPQAGTQKSAGEIDLSPDMLVKLAKDILATNEGVAFARYTLEKAAGARQADEMIKSACMAAQNHDEVTMIKQAAFNEGMQSAEQIHANLSQMITEDDADSILKQASLHCENLDLLEHPMLKAAYAAGMDDAQALEAAAEEGAEEPAMPMGGEELSMEDVLMILQEMIDNGEISEEEVIAGLQELQNSAEGADEEELEA